jgi:hypothetical protein
MVQDKTNERKKARGSARDGNAGIYQFFWFSMPMT